MYKSKSSILATLIIVAMLVAAVVALGVFSSGFTNWDLTTWFDESESQTSHVNDKDTSEDVNAPIIDIGESVGNGVSFTSTVIPRYEYEEYGVSMLAENAYTLTATISPSTADNKLVDWSIAWQNSSSSWASGKNVIDYVNISPESDGSLTAVVSCLQPFAEQIIISCVSRDNTEISATCSVDYYSRISKLDAVIKSGSSSVNLSSGSKIPFKSSMSFSVSLNESDGTLSDNFIHTVSVSFTTKFGDYLEDYTHDYIGGMCIRDFFGTGFTNSYNLSYGTLNYTFFENLCYSSTGGSYTIDDDPYFIDVFYSALKSYTGNVFKFTLRSTGENSGILKEAVYEVPVDTSSLVIHVNSVNINDSNIFF